MNESNRVSISKGVRFLPSPLGLINMTLETRFGSQVVKFPFLVACSDQPLLVVLMYCATNLCKIHQSNCVYMTQGNCA